MATILVTGGAGYIGSHTCKALAGAGHTPVTYDNLSRGFAHAVKWGPLEQGDILDAARLADVIARHRPDAVIHFAAFAYVGEAMDDPALYYRNNVVGTQSLLEAMRAGGVSRIVFSSSCTTYGQPAA
ncbi:MAG: NAD-dependent epimerase/dehydratase family protein, partial [Caulobacteraceae bacterium]